MGNNRLISIVSLVLLCFYYPALAQPNDLRLGKELVITGGTALGPTTIMTAGLSYYFPPFFLTDMPPQRLGLRLETALRENNSKELNLGVDYVLPGLFKYAGLIRNSLKNGFNYTDYSMEIEMYFEFIYAMGFSPVYQGIYPGIAYRIDQDVSGAQNQSFILYMHYFKYFL